MGFMDKMKQATDQLKTKAEDLAGEHGTKIKDGIDKAAGAAEKRAGKNKGKVGQLADKAKGLVDKLADDADAPEGSTEPAATEPDTPQIPARATGATGAEWSGANGTTAAAAFVSRSPQVGDALHASWVEARMQDALAAASEAAAGGDVPVGALIVRAKDGTVVARGRNDREQRGDPTGHAEVVAVRGAARELGAWRLDECIAVVTLEPCVMCAGVLHAARIGGVVFGAQDPKAGALGTLYNIAADPRLNHEFPVRAGVLASEAAQQLRQFFADRR